MRNVGYGWQIAGWHLHSAEAKLYYYCADMSLADKMNINAIQLDN